jgi:hypothetical protein
MTPALPLAYAVRHIYSPSGPHHTPAGRPSSSSRRRRRRSLALGLPRRRLAFLQRRAPAGR